MYLCCGDMRKRHFNQRWASNRVRPRFSAFFTRTCAWTRLADHVLARTGVSCLRLVGHFWITQFDKKILKVPASRTWLLSGQRSNPWQCNQSVCICCCTMLLTVRLLTQRKKPFWAQVIHRVLLPSNCRKLSHERPGVLVSQFPSQTMVSCKDLFADVARRAKPDEDGQCPMLLRVCALHVADVAAWRWKCFNSSVCVNCDQRFFVRRAIANSIVAFVNETTKFRIGITFGDCLATP